MDQEQADSSLQLKQSITEKIEELAQAFSQIVVDSLPYEPQSLIPRDAKARQIQAKEKEKLFNFVERFALGVEQIIIAQEKIGPIESDIFTPDVVESLQKLTCDVAGLQKLALQSLSAFDEKRSIKEIMGLNDSTMRALYRVCVEIYNEARYKEAAAAFSVFTLLEPLHHDAWIALGNADCFCQRYNGALIAYAMATVANPQNPKSHFSSAYCYEALKEYEKAMSSLDLALFVIDNKPEYQELVHLANTQKTRLSSLLARSSSSAIF